MAGRELLQIRQKLDLSSDNDTPSLRDRQKKVVGLLEPKLSKLNTLLAPLAQETIDTVKELARKQDNDDQTEPKKKK